MATRGRKPKSIEQHEEDGTFQPSRHAGRGVAGSTAEIKRPTYLTAGQRKAWDELVEDRSWITASDAPIVEAAAIALDIARRATKDIKKDGLYQTTKYGRSPSASVKLARQAWAEVRAFSTLLGLSPADRARLCVELAGDDDDEDSFASEARRSMERHGVLRPAS